MKPNTILLSLAAMLGVAAQAPAAQELSTTALKAVRGGITCIMSAHWCACDVPHSGCCPNPNTCTYLDAKYVWQTPYDYWTCSNSTEYAASCDDTTNSVVCCTKYYYLSEGCVNYWGSANDTAKACGVC